MTKHFGDKEAMTGQLLRRSQQYTPASCILLEDISLEIWHFTKTPIFLPDKVKMKVNFKLQYKEYTENVHITIICSHVLRIRFQENPFYTSRWGVLKIILSIKNDNSDLSYFCRISKLEIHRQIIHTLHIIKIKSNVVKNSKRCIANLDPPFT